VHEVWSHWSGSVSQTRRSTRGRRRYRSSARARGRGRMKSTKVGPVDRLAHIVRAVACTDCGERPRMRARSRRGSSRPARHRTPPSALRRRRGSGRARRARSREGSGGRSRRLSLDAGAVRCWRDLGPASIGDVPRPPKTREVLTALSRHPPVRNERRTGTAAPAVPAACDTRWRSPGSSSRRASGARHAAAASDLAKHRCGRRAQLVEVVDRSGHARSRLAACGSSRSLPRWRSASTMLLTGFGVDPPQPATTVAARARTMARPTRTAG
jgi:hypothetical protein